MQTPSSGKKIVALQQLLVVVSCIGIGAIITLLIVGPEGTHLLANASYPDTAGEFLLAFILNAGHQLGSAWMVVLMSLSCLVAYGTIRVVAKAVAEIVSGFCKNVRTHTPTLRHRKTVTQGTHPSSFNE